MRLLISALAATSLLGAVSTAVPAGAAPKPAATKSTKAQYECKMCQLMTAKAGKCPKCGMAMTKTNARKAATAKYECKMCGIATARAGKCPKCEMEMTKVGGSPVKPARK